jgi:MraZ protein
MAGFLGEYDCTLDPKGRFLLPAKFKEQLQENENSQFVVNRGMDTCLGLYTIREWQPLFDRINKLNDFDTKIRRFKRFFLNGATMTELDSAGRLLVPQTLREYAGLGKDITLVSMGNRLEIWDVSKYKKELFESMTQDEFRDAAGDIMKDIS